VGVGGSMVVVGLIGDARGRMRRRRPHTYNGRCFVYTIHSSIHPTHPSIHSSHPINPTQPASYLRQSLWRPARGGSTMAMSGRSALSARCSSSVVFVGVCLWRCYFFFFHSLVVVVVGHLQSSSSSPGGGGGHLTHTHRQTHRHTHTHTHHFVHGDWKIKARTHRTEF
jgi:hypothetical protein